MNNREVMGIKVPKNYRVKEFEELLNGIKKYWEKGVHVKEIAEKLNCCESTVFKYAGKMGLKRKKKPIENIAEKVVKDYLNGETIEMIAGKYDYAENSIRGILSRHGVFKAKEYYGTRECNICGNKFVMKSKWERFCPGCRRLVSNYDYTEYRVHAGA